MGWSTTAPTLPSGSTWVQVDTLWYEDNNLKITGTIYVARLDGENFAVKVTETRKFYRTGFTDVYHRCDVAGVTGTAATGTWPADSGSTVNYYFTGVASAGASIKVVVGRKADSTEDMITKTFTAPDLLGPTIYINVNGTARKSVKFLLNVNGTARTVTAARYNN